MTAQEDGACFGERAVPVTALRRADVPATADRLHPLRQELAEWAAAVGVTTELTDALILAADEALSNAVSHAYEPDHPGTLDLDASYDPDHNTVHVTVRDRGRWQEADPEPGPLGGRGLILIRALAHEATFEQTSTGTTVRMTWRLTSQCPSDRTEVQNSAGLPSAVVREVTEDGVVDEPTDSRLAALLRDNSENLIDRWVGLAAPALRGRITEAELTREVRGLYAAIAPILTGSRLSDADAAEVKALLSELSSSRARQGFTPSETATSVFALKQAVFELTEQNTDPAVFQELMALSRTLDTLGLWTFEAYAQARDDIIREQSEQLLELTTPVIKLWEGVLAVPLVGTLDSARTQVVMEKLLEALVETGSEHAIIDITGVLAVDTQVAQHLLKTVAAARLMGAECTISGIRPQIAQTIVALGIDLGDIATKASLADALLHAFRRSGVDVVRRGGRDS